MDISPKAPPSRKGSLHPYAVSCSGGISIFRPVATNDPSRIPPVRPAVQTPHAHPARDGGTCALTKTQAPGTSPPTAAPFLMRMGKHKRGVQQPNEAQVGR